MAMETENPMHALRSVLIDRSSRFWGLLLLAKRDLGSGRNGNDRADRRGKGDT